MPSDREQRTVNQVLADNLALFSASLQALACQPYGWVLMNSRQISTFERLCEYEKLGTRVTIMVSGFCPFHPC